MKNKVKAIILGCGGSGGVPSVGLEGGFWGSCDPTNPKNNRTRASIFVEIEDQASFLIDTSPDLRHQLLAEDISDFNAVLYTHDHADHIHGIDELRSLYFSRGHKPLPVYSYKKFLDIITKRFSYLVTPQGIYPKVITLHEMKEGKNTVEDVEIIAFTQHHGEGQISIGYRFGNLAYSTDFNSLDKKALEHLEGVKVWIIDCLSSYPRPTHNHLDLTLDWIKKVNPERAILTHMGHTLDYDFLVSQLPPHIEPAYDGMVIECL
jgi:phosphoribosyl 1,2-cyclic phosphate phosphodiesterase